MRLAMWLACAPLLGSAVGAAAQASSIRPGDLRCEYQTDPLGVQTEQPRLSWECEATDPGERGLRQSAYQIRVAPSRQSLVAGYGDLWESGKVESGESLHIEYAGRPLEARERVWWAVRVWDQFGRRSEWSEPAAWTMGILSGADWQAEWIARGDANATTPANRPPLFRKDFGVGKSVSRAVVRVCGLGHYALSLNGQAVNDSWLDPGWTNYRETCQYDTYDVTNRLETGENALGVALGNGMYNVPGGRYVKFTGTFGEPKLILELTIDYADGTREFVGTDATWMAAEAPTVFSCIYGGEDYDARLEQPGWDAAGFEDSAWRPAVVTEGPGGALRARLDAPVIVQEEHAPVAVTKLGPGSWVYDFGQNLSGVPRITLRGKAGSTVRMTPGELVNPDGSVTQASSGGPMWFDYTLKGSGTETWSPRFTYYGYRYVQVDGAAPADAEGEAVDLPRVEAIASLFLWPRVEEAGHFECSNPDIARVRHLILSAVRSNLKSVLTDCPHREKLGWLECSYLIAGPVMYNYGLAPFYAKVARDTVEAQTPEGLVPDIAPEYVVFEGGFRDSPEWGSACILAPWAAYVEYGDKRTLAESYETMRRYVEYLGTMATGHIVSHGLGDWYDVGPAGNGPSQLTSIGLTATGLYYQDIRTLERVARVLGKTEDAAEYARLGDEVREAFNAAFLHADTASYDRNSQTANAMPLCLDLPPAELRDGVVKSLVDGIRASGDRVTAGDVGFSYVVRALTDADQGEVLYDMVVQDEGPGYIHQLREGATTLIEAWDANRGASQNHCMLGHCEEWFYRGAAGIRNDEGAPGYAHFMLRPQVVPELTWARAEYDSPRGTILSAWKRTGHWLTWEVTVPPNTAATVCVPTDDAASVRESGRAASEAGGLRFVRAEPGYAEFEAGSGTYRFRSRVGVR